MKILFVLEHYYPYIGGAETLFQNLAEALAGQGQEVTVVTVQFDPELPLKEVHKGVNIVRVKARNRYLFTFLSLPVVIRLARRADFVHTTTYNAALPAWVGAKWCRKKIIVTFHEVWGDLWFRLPFISKLSARAFYSFEKLLLLLPFDHYVAVSEFTRRSLVDNGVEARRVKRIYNGLEYEKFAHYASNPPDNFTYTYFGRLGISKGLELLIPAAARLAEEHPSARLQLIIPYTPAAMFSRVMKMIDEYAIRDQVILRHELSRDELYRTIADSSCVVIPSYQEGFCFVAAEAVALGVPIVSSGRGALAETVSGPFLEMESQTIDSLYKALLKAHQGHYEEREIRRFTLSDSVAEYLKMYREITVS